MGKSHFLMSFSVLGALNHQIFSCSNEEKINKNNKKCSSPISMVDSIYFMVMPKWVLCLYKKRIWPQLKISKVSNNSDKKRVFVQENRILLLKIFCETFKHYNGMQSTINKSLDGSMYPG
jgi:hypothetical protein